MRIRYSSKAVETFLDSLNIEHRVLNDGEIAINSPFVGDTTFDCRISVRKQCWHDFESDESGNIEEIASVLAKVNIEEARMMLLSLGSIEVSGVPKKEPEILETKTISLPVGIHSFNKTTKHYSVSNFKAAKSFLVKKLVSYELAKKYKLMWTNYSFLTITQSPIKKMNMSHRIIIPSYEDGNLVYFQGRDYSNKSEMRYKNPPKDIQRKSIIVPFYDLIMPNEILFISEGPWEAIQYSGTYMLGPGLSDRQIYKIKKKNPKAIYLIPDNDETARRKLSKNVSLLRSYIDCPIYIVKWWKDELAKFKDPIDAKITFDDIINSDFIEANRNIDLKIKMGVI